MAIFVAVNFLAMRIFARVNNVITWWKVAIPVLTIIVLLTQWHSGNFTAGGAGFLPGGINALFAALPAAGIVFAYSGFEQCDQLAGEIKNPGRNLPRAIIYSILIGTAIYCLLQVVFIAAMPPGELTHGFSGITNKEILDGPWAGLTGLIGLSWLAFLLRIDAFVSPSGTGLIYTTGTSRVSYGLSRNRYFPQIFGKVDRNGVPWVGLIFAFIIGLFFLLPFPSWHSLVGLITGASVLMYAGAPLSVGAFRGQVPEAPRPYRMPAAWVLAPAAFAVADLLIYWSGFEVVWKLGVVLVLGYVVIGIFMAFDPQRPPLDWKSAVLAAGLADRHGHHLLAGPVQRRGRATSIRCRRPTPSTSGSGGTSWSSSRSAWPSTSGRWPPSCRGTRCSCWSTSRAAERKNCRPPPATESASAATGAAPSPDGATLAVWPGRDTSPFGIKSRCGAGIVRSAGAGPPVAGQHAALDERPRHRPEPAAVHRAGVRGCPIRATSRRQRGGRRA